MLNLFQHLINKNINKKITAFAASTMKISIELTLTPLKDDYEPHIIDFIKALRASEFKVLENPLSTQIYGDYDTLMPFLTREIKKSFSEIEIAVLNMKIVKTDRSDYEPDF